MALTATNMIWMGSLLLVMVIFIVTALVGSSKSGYKDEDEE